MDFLQKVEVFKQNRQSIMNRENVISFKTVLQIFRG